MEKSGRPIRDIVSSHENERPGPKCQGAKRPGPKCQTIKRPGPKFLEAKRPVQNKSQGAKRPGPKRLSPESPVRKRFLSLHFMIVKVPLWLWHSLRLLYDCDVLLLLSFKFVLWLVNWFDLIRGNMILLIKNFHLEMTLTSTLNVQVRDLDLQAKGGVGDSTEKICGLIPITRPCMNPIYPRVYK